MNKLYVIAFVLFVAVIGVGSIAHHYEVMETYQVDQYSTDGHLIKNLALKRFGC